MCLDLRIQDDTLEIDQPKFDISNKAIVVSDKATRVTFARIQNAVVCNVRQIVGEFHHCTISARFSLACETDTMLAVFAGVQAVDLEARFSLAQFHERTAYWNVFVDRISNQVMVERSRTEALWVANTRWRH